MLVEEEAGRVPASGPVGDKPLSLVVESEISDPFPIVETPEMLPVSSTLV